MTCREKLMKEHPEKVGDKYNGGCSLCPSEYGYLDNPKWCNPKYNCARCWNREIPGTERDDIIDIVIQIENILHNTDLHWMMMYNPDTKVYGITVSKEELENE